DPTKITEEARNFYSQLYSCGHCLKTKLCDFCYKWRLIKDPASWKPILKFEQDDEYNSTSAKIKEFLPELDSKISRDEILSFINNYNKKYKSPGPS
ncbi:Hypothetical protein FKW44_016818, partial [Caligus rogercresseyi]